MTEKMRDHGLEYDQAIPHAPELREAYVRLMAASVHCKECGIFADRIVLRFVDKGLYDEACENAINICEAWRNGRNAQWIVLPPGRTDKSDPLGQAGYVGCRLADHNGLTVDDVRKLLLPQ